MPPLLKGLAIGFSIAAPVGPIGLLCIRRALAEGRTAGFVSGLGAATADALYGMIAALGLTAITQALVAAQSWLQFAGGVFLFWLGLATLRAAPPKEAGQGEAPAATGSPSLYSAYFSVLVLPLANPMTILSFLGIFAGLGLGAGSAAGLEGISLVLGVFLGSAAWWLLLSATSSWFGGRLRPSGLRGLNVASGLMIAGFGA